MSEPKRGRKPRLAPFILLLSAIGLAISAVGAHGGAAVTALYSFQRGEGCSASLVQGRDGSFYGTTTDGGTNNPSIGLVAPISNSNGVGTVFKVTPNGALTTLYSFSGGSDGAYPCAGLVQGRDGSFYGTTSGGLGYWGTVFKISANGVFTSLYSFGSVANTNGLPYLRDWLDGANPNGLAQGSDGNFYGTTANGGTNGGGTVFKIDANGALTTLHSFTGASEGSAPYAGLVQGSDGNFYGTTFYAGANGGGTVFKISTNGALTTLYSFTGANDGAHPQAALAQGSDGNFYGTTTSGGAYTNYLGQGCGTVFKIGTNGLLTSLYSFTGGSDGSYPQAALVQGSDGYFYGTTASGGAYELGNVFKITPDGVLTTLYSFSGGSDGASPCAGLVRGNDGRFYGTTAGMNMFGAGGSVFRLTIAPALEAMTLTSGTLGLTSSAEAGGTYQWQYTSDLTSSNWTNLGNPATATGATLSATDSVTSGPQRFYRLVLSP